jgi:hypothetical protein
MTRINNRSLRIVALGLGLSGFSPMRSRTPQAQPDNTKNNQGDNDKGAVTADQQKMSLADREKDSQVYYQ